LHVFGDNDADFVGRIAANNLARRASRRGVKVSVQIPLRLDSDWLDVLKRRRSDDREAAEVRSLTGL